jgi:hypothetical protein
LTRIQTKLGHIKISQPSWPHQSVHQIGQSIEEKCWASITLDSGTTRHYGKTEMVLVYQTWYESFCCRVKQAWIITTIGSVLGQVWNLRPTLVGMDEDIRQGDCFLWSQWDMVWSMASSPKQEPTIWCPWRLKGGYIVLRNDFCP